MVFKVVKSTLFCSAVLVNVLVRDSLYWLLWFSIPVFMHPIRPLIFLYSTSSNMLLSYILLLPIPISCVSSSLFDIICYKRFLFFFIFRGINFFTYSVSYGSEGFRLTFSSLFVTPKNSISLLSPSPPLRENSKLVPSWNSS